MSDSGHGLEQRRAQRPARGGDARLGERHFVGAGERGGAESGGVALGVEQPVGAVLVVGSSTARRRIRAGSALSVQASKLPSRHNSRTALIASSTWPVAAAARARASLPALDCGGSAAKNFNDRRRGQGMNEELGFLPVAEVASPRPGRMGAWRSLRARRNRRMRIGAQGSPFQRQPLVRIARPRPRAPQAPRRRPCDRPAPRERERAAAAAGTAAKARFGLGPASVGLRKRESPPRPARRWTRQASRPASRQRRFRRRTSAARRLRPALRPRPAAPPRLPVERRRLPRRTERGEVLRERFVRAAAPPAEAARVESGGGRAAASPDQIASRSEIAPVLNGTSAIRSGGGRGAEQARWCRQSIHRSILPREYGTTLLTKC